MAWTKIYYDTSRQDQLTTVSDDKGNVTQTRINMLVCVDDGTSGQPNLADATVASISGGNSVPLVGGTYTIEGQDGYVCMQTYPKRTAESPFVIEIQCTYVRKFVYQPPDATRWNIKISIAGAKTTQPAYQGYNTDTSTTEDLQNSAGQPLDPEQQETLCDESITVSYNTLEPPDFLALRGKVNSDDVSFTISGVSRSYTANQLLLDDATISTTTTLSDMATAVWQVTATLLAREDTFTRNILDAGYATWDGSHLQQAYDVNFERPNKPVKLDGSGAILAHGGTPVYRHYNIEKQAALSSVFDGLS